MGHHTIEQPDLWALLATDAVPKALLPAGKCTRQPPSDIALRGNVHAPSSAGKITALELA